MESINVENDSLPNEEDNDIEKESEKISLKQTRQNDTSNYIHKRRKKIHNKNNFIKNASVIIFFSVLFFLFIGIFLLISINNEKKNYHLTKRKAKENITSSIESTYINQNEDDSKEKIKETDDSFSIIEEKMLKI